LNYPSIKKVIKSNKYLSYLFGPLIYCRQLPSKFNSYRFNREYNKFFEMVTEGSLVIELKDFRGFFEIDIRSDIFKMILKYKNYEQNIVKIVEKYVDSSKDAIDVGANIGLFTILLAHILSNKNKVLSLEPAPMAYQYLKRNLERNNCQNSVIIYNGIATNIKGNYKLNIIQGMEEYSSLGNLVHPAIANRQYKKIDVEGDTIDNLVNEYNLAPGFIKIDTEGAEYLVLSGAAKTIKKYKPVIVVEVQDRLHHSVADHSEKIIYLLKENNYNLINANNPKLQVGVPFNGDMLALPNKV